MAGAEGFMDVLKGVGATVRRTYVPGWLGGGKRRYYTFNVNDSMAVRIFDLVRIRTGTYISSLVEQARAFPGFDELVRQRKSAISWAVQILDPVASPTDPDKLQPVIDSIFSFADVPKAYQKLATGR